jgi:broad specificity phosphatase PhoE
LRLYLVRHAAVTVRPDLPGRQWHLSPEGRAAAGALANEPYWAEVCALHTSPEPKAVATAQRLAAGYGRPIRIEPDLREVENRAWVGEGYRELVRRYLAGDSTSGWEPREAALGRVRACIDGIVARYGDLEVGIVSHGLVLTVYLADLLGLDGNGCYGLWSRLRMPDIAAIDPDARRLERAFGHAGAER